MTKWKREGHGKKRGYIYIFGEGGGSKKRKLPQLSDLFSDSLPWFCGPDRVQCSAVSGSAVPTAPPSLVPSENVETLISYR